MLETASASYGPIEVSGRRSSSDAAVDDLTLNDVLYRAPERFLRSALTPFGIKFGGLCS